MLIRSQGTEIERIEEYDIVSAMLDDAMSSQAAQANKLSEGKPQLLPESLNDSLQAIG